MRLISGILCLYSVLREELMKSAASEAKLKQKLDVVRRKKEESDTIRYNIEVN